MAKYQRNEFECALGSPAVDISLWTIFNGLNQLKQIRDKGLRADFHELDWEIKLYEWILGQPDAAQKATRYLDKRFPRWGKVTYSKREVVKELGWRIY